LHAHENSLCAINRVGRFLLICQRLWRRFRYSRNAQQRAGNDDTQQHTLTHCRSRRDTDAYLSADKYANTRANSFALTNNDTHAIADNFTHDITFADASANANAIAQSYCGTDHCADADGCTNHYAYCSADHHASAYCCTKLHTDSRQY
jgi:hypothetical protein